MHYDLYLCAKIGARRIMITTLQFKTLDDLYQFYNDRLFGSKLPECIVNMSRKGGSYGFFVPERWKGENMQRKIIHEISVNPDFMDRPDKEWHSTLVHDMCHLWQYEFGNPSRSCYHNKQWAAKMIDIGLMPSDTGEPGGKTTGQQMSHYIIEGGLFDVVFNALKEEDLESLRLKYRPLMAFMPEAVHETIIPSEELVAEIKDNIGKAQASSTGKSGKRTRYTCGCGHHVWGRPGLWIRCEECNMIFLED